MLPVGDYVKTARSHDNWATPKKLYNAFMGKGYQDPCPLNCKHNGLVIQWYNSKLFINPPFSDIERWSYWALEQYDNNCDIWFLMPARTDTKYFHALISKADKVYFFKSRLDFNDCGVKAPFPTILIHLKSKMYLPIFDFGTLEDFIFKYLTHEKMS